MPSSTASPTRSSRAAESVGVGSGLGMGVDNVVKVEMKLID